MLCLTKAAKYLSTDYEEDLLPIIQVTAPLLMKQYTIDLWVGQHQKTPKECHQRQ